MRKLRMFVVALVFVLASGLAAAGPTIDDVVDQARQNIRQQPPRAVAAIQVANVPAPYWSPQVAAAGTLILLTALAMAGTSLLLELGFPSRRPARVRIRFKLA